MGGDHVHTKGARTGSEQSPTLAKTRFSVDAYSFVFLRCQPLGIFSLISDVDYRVYGCPKVMPLL